MKRGVLVSVAVATVLAAAAAGFGAFLLVYRPGPHRPEISAYSNGHSIRVGPYVYCDVLDLDDCETPQTQGELRVDVSNPVQLSVPAAIGRAPWMLTLVYRDATVTTPPFEPNSRLAVTIPTANPVGGELNGIVVHLMTMVRTPDGELIPTPHAEWSVATVWD